MKLTDKRLWQAIDIYDFIFRLGWDEGQPPLNREATPNAVVMPDFSRTWGIDISHWNGLTDLATAKARGCSFVIIKACDGSVPTRWYQENKAQAKSAGLVWGCYVWLYPGAKVSIPSQIKAWWNLVKDDYPPMGVFIDYEWTNYAGKPANPGPGDLQAALDQFFSISGRKAEVYTSAGYTGTAGMIKNPNNWEWWLAHYGVTNPTHPAGVGEWHLHQFTDKLDGSIAPCENLALDGNYFNGSHQDFEDRYGAVVTPPGGPMWYRVNTSALNVRSGPDVSFPKVSETFALILGDLIYGVEELNGWVRFDVISRNGSAVTPPGPTCWCSKGYLVADTGPVVPPSQWPAYFDLTDPEGKTQRYSRA